MTESERSSAITRALTRWFETSGRSYPWRETRDPWAILVSEVMLQQTTIPAVLNRYAAWMARFPTPAALADATEEEALRSWEGLGYYTRVRSLRAAARAVCKQYGGAFPRDAGLLRRLPGIGEYTAGALLSFAFDLPAPLVDANAARVLTRLDNDFTPADSAEGRRRLRRRAEELLDRRRPRVFNSALMELGQTFCLPHRPDCLLCPCREHCLAENPEALPVKTARPPHVEETHHDLLCVTPRGVLVEKQAEGKRHQGMYRLPRRNAESTRGLPLLCRQKYSVTRYKITRLLYASGDPAQARPGEEWIGTETLEKLPMASPDRKMLRRFLNTPMK
ncbi:MAG: hypothetical protein LUG84_09180 [Akkermansiaceae bacterium]|nr:hypothetical protein [Akkermansiaceae bacterium]